MSIYQDPPKEPVRQWAFLGPLTIVEQNDQVKCRFADGLDFAARQKGKTGKEIGWRLVETEADGVALLDQVVADPNDTESYWCAALQSPRQQVVQIGIGAGAQWNSAFATWLNGEYLHGRQGHPGGLSPTANLVIATLKEGENILLLRLQERAEKGPRGMVMTFRGDGVKATVPEGVGK